MLLLAGFLQAAVQSLTVTGIIRVTDAPGIRDNVVALRSADQTVILWDESPGIDRSGSTLPPVQIWRARLPRGSDPVPERFIAGHSNQWHPAVIPTERGAILAYYVAESSHRTGDRDIMLQPLDPALRLEGSAKRGTSDGDVPLPLNDATPALLRLADGRMVVVWSRGAFDERSGKYADKDLILAEVSPDGAIVRERALTGRDEAGHEVSPTLAMRDGGRVLLVYVSDSARGGRPALYARTLDGGLRVGPPRRLTLTERGVTRPSLARAGATLWISWYDLEANDVMIARVASDSAVSSPVGLRSLLLKAGFENYGVPYAGLSGASLFVDQGKLGIVFVATMLFDREAGRAQQDVF